MFKHGKRYFNFQFCEYLQSYSVLPVLFLSLLFSITRAIKSKVRMYLNNLFPLVNWIGRGVFVLVFFFSNAELLWDISHSLYYKVKLLCVSSQAAVDF